MNAKFGLLIGSGARRGGGSAGNTGGGSAIT